MKVIKFLENKRSFIKNNYYKNYLSRKKKPLMTAGLQLMENVLTPLAKSVLIPLELAAVVSATDASI